MKSPPVTMATPPKAPKGRFFVVGMVLTLLGFGAFRAWDSFFRYTAFGVIDGRRVEVPAPVTGLVRYVHVQEGDRVRQGDLLLTLDQHELELRLDRLDDQRRLAQAKLDAEMSAAQWRITQYLVQFHEAAGEYREKWADVRERQVRWQRAQQFRERVAGLVVKKSATQDELDAALADEHAQRDRLETLV
jgi:multidrug resistance efflux pump